MKCTIPEISWHNREPVLSIHLQPVSEKFYRLATGGADCHVLIWQLIVNDNGAVKNEALSDLTRHQRAVNSVRWSPNGQYLATADDDANIIIWQLKTDNIPLLEGETSDKETWLVYKVMRGHKEDIYDLCWSPNGLKLLSGSVDNTAILWDFTKGKTEQILTDHKGFVQGVAWDPKGLYVATISTDRICRIYDSSGKQVKHRVQKGCLPVSEAHYLYNKDVKYFYDDTFKSFFRRLDFSPDATLLAVPSGRAEIEDCKKIFNATLIFAVDSWAMPIAVLPSGKQCSTVVRFCPLLFELHEEGPDPIIPLRFRMILAVGTDHDVILYDTQQMEPFAYFKDIHYTRLTDLTWSSDGLLLVASSTDGYCALITFEPNELGVQYLKEESEAEESTLDISGCEILEKEDNAEFVKPKKLNLLEKWTVKTPKKHKGEVPGPSKSDDDTSKRKREDESEVAPKRIKPTPVLNKTEDLKNKNNSQQAPKRINPIAVNDKPDENRKVKVSPLLNFLKKASKPKPDESVRIKTATLTPVNVVLDEIEARDAWNNEKHETKSSEVEVIDLDDYTEDFSLHLEDTNSKTVQSESKCVQSNTEVPSNIGDEIGDTVSDSLKKDGSNSEDKTEITQNETKIDEQCAKIDNKEVVVETGSICSQTEIVNNLSDVAKMDNTENCVQNTDIHIESKQDINELKTNNEMEKEKLQTVMDKTNIPKRRIPLITLSSPKQKKK